MSADSNTLPRQMRWFLCGAIAIALVVSLGYLIVAFMRPASAEVQVIGWYNPEQQLIEVVSAYEARQGIELVLVGLDDAELELFESSSLFGNTGAASTVHPIPSDLAVLDADGNAAYGITIFTSDLQVYELRRGGAIKVAEVADKDGNSHFIVLEAR